MAKEDYLLRIPRPLVTGCAYCKKIDNLKLCETCQAAYFCSTYHKRAMTGKHAGYCAKVCEMRYLHQRLKSAEKTVQSEKEATDRRFSSIIRSVGAITEGLAEILGKIGTRLAWEQRLELLMDIGHPLMNPRDMATELIRLDREDKLYSLMETPKTLFEGYEYVYTDWCQILSIDKGKTVDPWSDINFGPDIMFILLLILIRVKMLISLEDLQATLSIIGPKVPREILDHIRSFVPISPLVRGNLAVLYHDDHTERIDRLRHQIKTVKNQIESFNCHIWPFIIHGKGCDEYPPTDECDVTCRLLFHMWRSIGGAWLEIPGVLKCIASIE